MFSCSQGTTKQILSCPEGTPTVMSINGHFLVVGMSTTCVKVWDISRRQVKYSNRAVSCSAVKM